MRDFDSERLVFRRFGIGESALLAGVPIGVAGVEERWIRSGMSRARIVVDKFIEEEVRKDFLASSSSD